MSIAARRTMLGGPLLVAGLLLGACVGGGGTPFDNRLANGIGTMDAASFYAAFERSASAGGGNAVIGSSRMEEGRRVALSMRATATGGASPLLDGRTVSVTGMPDGPINTTSTSEVTVVADLAVQPFPGFRVGTGRILSLDLLVSAGLMQGGGDNLDIETDSPVSFGFGWRLGVIPETRTTPAVALSYTARQLPTYSLAQRRFATDDGNHMDVSVDDAQPEIESVRVTASKRIGQFGVTAGFGRDEFQSSQVVSARYQPSSGPLVSDSRPSFVAGERTHLFVGGSATLGGVLIAAELGRVTGSMDAIASDHFSHAIDRSRGYLSVGTRLEFGGSAGR